MATPSTTPAQPTPSEVIACTSLAFQWADYYDTKAFSSLPSILTPIMLSDYSAIRPDAKPERMAAKAFADMIGSLQYIGDPAMQTQHFLGAAKWTTEDPTPLGLQDEKHNTAQVVQATFQVRVAHQKVIESGEAAHATGHGVVTFGFVKIEDGWKIAVVKPALRWVEGDMKKLMPKLRPEE